MKCDGNVVWAANVMNTVDTLRDRGFKQAVAFMETLLKGSQFGDHGAWFEMQNKNIMFPVGMEYLDNLGCQGLPGPAKIRGIHITFNVDRMLMEITVVNPKNVKAYLEGLAEVMGNMGCDDIAKATPEEVEANLLKGFKNFWGEVGTDFPFLPVFHVVSPSAMLQIMQEDEQRKNDAPQKAAGKGSAQEMKGTAAKGKGKTMDGKGKKGKGGKHEKGKHKHGKGKK